ncbi:PLP-dependent aminotransferase family protein [Cypionkella sp. TWP1-2-1b2]|uniref:MocR-like pyridoxine biosynthesis transcription factor PdxR n=1 Tax=Cypionkella sp. TWP1-2-1b2 TaxID=2804675 RepID=UPI003CEF06CC
MSRTAAAPFQIQIPLNRGLSAAPLADQIAAHLRTAVLAQTLRPAEQVPSTRALAAALGVSRMTADTAYAQLIAEGYLEAKPGSGTRVVPQGQISIPLPPGTKSKPPLRTDLPPRAALLAEVARNLTVQAAIPLAISAPNETLAPGKAWTRIAIAQARTPWRDAAYSGPHGLPALRIQIAEYVRRMRGITCTPDQILITAGTQQGLSLTARVLFQPGDQVWLENPGYIPLRAVVQDAGLIAVPIPVDHDGLSVAAGLHLAPHAAGAYVTPSHQYPLGAVLTMERRLALLTWAQARKAWIIEDDYDSELRYDGRPIPALAGLDAAEGAVIYLGTFSKMLFPGLRLGYLIAPTRLADAFAGARILADRHAQSTDQRVLAEYLAGGHYDAHIRRIRLLFAARRAILLAECAAQLTDFGTVVPGDQGMHVLFRFHTPLDDVHLATTLRGLGIETRALSPFYAHSPTCGLLLGFGSFDAAQIKTAITAIRQALHPLTREPHGKQQPPNS